jgi:hypothetical protein
MNPHQTHCCCRRENAADCLEARCGPSRDYDGRREECSCECHYEIARDDETDDDE